MVDNFFRLPVLYRVKTGFDDQLDGAAALLSHSVQQQQEQINQSQTNVWRTIWQLQQVPWLSNLALSCVTAAY